MPASPGQTLSHYRLIEKIGEGGMGVVWKAEDERLKRHIAIKILPQDLVANEERRLRFLREARAAAAVTHPNIATIHEIDEADGVVFIAMELVEGKTLRRRLTGRPLPQKDTLRIATDVAEGLARAHQAHVVHRDLKPENIMVGPDGHAKILDFGLAKLLEQHPEARTADLSRLTTLSGELTQAGKVLGTASYMSPEQARGEPVDSRSDIFSLGTVLYEMSTGRRPFHGKTTTDVLSAIIRDQALPPSQVNPEVPPDLERVLRKCLEKAPEDRYQDTRDLTVDLRKLQRDSEASGPAAFVSSGPAGLSARSGWARFFQSRSRRVGIAVLALAVMGGAAGAWWYFRPPEKFKSGDRVFVGDFENTTGQPQFDTAVRDTFEDMLASSTFLQVVRGDNLKRLLASQGRDESARISTEIAGQICLKADCAGFLAGRIEPTGTGFEILVTLYHRGRSRPVLSRQVVASSSPQMVQSIYELALAVRKGLGEGPEATSMTSPPTATSLAAYQVFATAGGLDDPEDQAPLYRRAVELDAGFVDAYFGVAGALSNLKRESDARRYAEEGYRRSSKLDENLRLTYEISLRHYSYDFEGEIDCLKRQQILHPLDWGVPNVLAHISSYVYQDPSSAELYARAAYQKDRHWMNLDQLMNSLKLQGKTNEMRDVIADFQRTGGVPIKALFYGMLIPLVENRWGEVEKIIAQLEQDPGWGREVGASYRLQALLAAGKLSDAREATASAWRAGRERGWSGLQYTSDLRRQWLDLRLEGKQPAFSTEQAEMARASLLNLPEIAAFCVDSGTEEPLAGMLAYHGQAEKDSKSRYVLEELQFARACLDLIRGQANRAQANLEPLARNSLFVRRHRVLGRAYEALGMWPQAAAEYEKGLKNPYLKWWSFENPAVWVLDQFRLAKVYERIGDKDSARQWYERFLADWKDADPDIPELKQARQQLAALGASQTAPRH